MNVKKSRKGLLLAVLSIFFCAAGFAQNSVTGTVSDEFGEPIIGAYITLASDSKVGTITDFDGNYEISVPDAAKLIFSYTGYESQTLSTAGKATLNVTLKEVSTKLNEVVAVGYGSQKAKEITSSVASVKSEDFNPGVKESPMGLLQGKVAGLTIIRSTGDPTNTGYAVQIRGTSTLDKGAGTSPLYIVDGIPVNNIDNIAPEDIASMDVLKDGSAAAIYGTRGTNGVIIITTKRGSTDNNAECGSTTLEYSGYASFATRATGTGMATAEQYKELASITDNVAKPADKGSETDWVAAQLRDFAFTHNHNLAISGATKNFSYRGSVNFKNAEGLTQVTNRQEIMAKLAANQKALQGWLELQYDFSYMHYRNDYNCGSIDDGAIINPTFPIYKEDGTTYFTPSGTISYNPISNMNLKESYKDGNYFRGSVRATVNIKAVPGLKVTGFAALEEGDNHSYWSNPSEVRPAKDANKAGIEMDRSFNQLYEATIDYTGQWNGHSLALVGGTSYQNFWYDGHKLENGGFATDKSKYYDIKAGAVDKKNMQIESWRNSNTLVAYFLRANYNYNEKYLLSASIRAEGSSRMGANNKWGWFPAVSAGWRISGEDFMRDAKGVDDLKLRFGFGVTGNNLGSDLKSLELLTKGGTFNSHGTEKYAFTVNQNPNPDLRWERKFEYNLGIDYAFLSNRLYGTLDLYYRNTKDLLWEYTVPTPPYQYDKLLANAGEMTSMGIELAITGVPVRTKNWEWATTATISFNQNRIDKLSDPELGFNYETTWAGNVNGNALNNVKTQLLTAGESVGTFYGYQWTGEFDADGNCIYVNQNGDVDEKGNPIIDDNDKVALASAQPLFTFGWNNSIKYKNWDLSFFFRGVVGNTALNVNRWKYAPVKGSNGLNVFYSEAVGIGEGKRSIFQKEFSDYYLEDASYLKLDNITLGYKVPLKENKYCQSLRVYFTAQNVATISSYSGTTPDAINYTSVWEPGLGGSDFYPQARTFLIGANVTF